MDQNRYQSSNESMLTNGTAGATFPFESAACNVKNWIIVYHLENDLSGYNDQKQMRAAGVCENQSLIYGTIAPPCSFLKVNLLWGYTHTTGTHGELGLVWSACLSYLQLFSNKAISTTTLLLSTITAISERTQTWLLHKATHKLPGCTTITLYHNLYDKT